MTPEQHAKEASRLKGAITRAKTALTKPMALADKIVAKQKVREAEDALREHKLNFYELTK